ncbi:hypothetical protein [Serratia fonticola]|uniref:Uncharacterized protein n=1 Tax=Serratia fonticola TaxID=47917 RepID=A0AAE7EJT7_SERFO|nr:hypothetical protein [Serratia fonticola]QKJ59829.1 hypothetical protein G9399_17890 [Serratia fonticola]
MNKSKIGLLMLGTLAFSVNAFAGISSQEQNMRNEVTKCVSDIQSYGNDPRDKSPLWVIYGTRGGAHKYCGSVAAKTRTAITPGYNQQEAWEAEWQDLFAEYSAIPKADANQPNTLKLVKKLRDLAAENKLDGRHAQSKLYVYRAMMRELDKLDAILPSVEGK